MPADALLYRLWGVTEDGCAQWRSYCPACQDLTHSLLIREDSDGAVSLHCDNGCPSPVIVRAVGLSPSRVLFPKSRKRRRHAPDPGWWLVPRRYPLGR